MISNNVASTLGTLHDLFLSNPNYGLNEFTSALYQFKPDIILSEVLPERPTSGDASIDGGIEQSIVFAYASENSIPVLATDWFNSDFIREMEEENSRVTPELVNRLQIMSEFRNSFQTASLLELNSDLTQNYIREIYKVFEKSSLLSSRKRNNRILVNIKKELQQLKGKKVLVIYGMDHKFFIDDHLQSVESVQIIEVSSWFKPEIGKLFKISDTLRSEVIQNLKNSESLLEGRLKSGHYLPELVEKLRSKLPLFEKWISAVSKL